MSLSEFLGAERGRCAALAAALRVAPAYVSQMASGARPMPPALVPATVRATGNAVREWMLRPDDWHRIWPELVGAEGAPPVPTPAEV
jgi:DNA-binding transcriptional regulator YdaS (Cro superfamily)